MQKIAKRTLRPSEINSKLRLLTLNVGSSSLKATLFERDLTPILDAEIQDLHLPVSLLKIGTKKQTIRLQNNLEKAFSLLMDELSIETAFGIGHRFIHGGWKYSSSILLNHKNLRDLQALSDFAPLHNPGCLTVIQASQKRFPKVPQIAVFDTAFHRTIPPTARTYGIPLPLATKHHIERFGFHGISHAYLASKVDVPKLITLHLGNGCSATAILHGKSVDTSMGFSPSEGLLMGTRAGDLDFTILEYLSKVERKSLKQITHMLNFESGLLGLSRKTSDVKTLLKNYHTNRNCRLAIDLFCYRIVKIIGAYAAVLNGVDAIVFSGGIGEHAPKIRAMILAQLKWLGVQFSSSKNEQNAQEIHTTGSKVQIHVVKTEENLFIAKEVCHLLNF